MKQPLAPLFAELDLTLTDGQFPLTQYPDSWDDIAALSVMEVKFSDGISFIHGGFNKDTDKYCFTFHTTEENNALYRWRNSPEVKALVIQICTEIDKQYAEENP